jgi:putative zinc finger/helix-turn-helix YgiT family protein
MSELTTCFNCGNESLRDGIVEIIGERNGQNFPILTDGYRCDICGFRTIDSEQSQEFTRRLSDAYRTANKLLTGAEIRERRMALGMTQQQFATYLGVGVASVRRWELGQIQDRAMDNLIRVMTDVGAALSNLHSVRAHIAEPHSAYSVAGNEILQQLDRPLLLCEEHKQKIQMEEFDFRSFAPAEDELVAA